MQAVFYIVSRPPNTYYANNVNRDTVLLKKMKRKKSIYKYPVHMAKQNSKQTNKKTFFFSVFSSQFFEFKDTVSEDTQSQVH